MNQLEPEPVRIQADVRARVDQILGHGAGMSPGEAWAQLTGVERVEWILGELWFGVSGPHHLWIQGQVERDLDAPRHVACLAHLAQELDEEVAGLMSWTAERARGVRAGERGEALMSIVPLVWSQALDRAGPVLRSLVERWPESLELGDLDQRAPLKRAICPPDAGGCRYPGVAIGFTPEALPSCDLVTPHANLAHETVLLGLWRCGASDDELEEFHAAASGPQDRLPEVLCEWVNFDGVGPSPDAKRLETFRISLDPIASILGLKSSQGSVLHRVKSERLGQLAEELAPYGGLRVQPTEDANFLIKARSALRSAPSVLLLDSSDLETSEHVTLVVRAVWSGMVVVMGGDAPGAHLVLGEIASNA